MLNLDDRLIKETLPRIKPNGLAVLLAIAIHLNKDQTCFPSQSKLRGLTGLGDESIYNALKVLKTEGLLVSSQSINSKNKTFGRRMFKVNTDLIGVFISAKNADALEEKPLTDFPDAAEPDAAEPDAANHETYLINDTLSINQSLSINNMEGGAPAEIKIPETFKAEKKETDFIPPAAAPTHAVTTHDPEVPGIVTVDPVNLLMSEAAPPPRKQKIETVDDAEAEILSWVLTETGKESVRNWYSNAARTCTMQDVKDMIQDFCRVYSTIGDEGKRQRFIKEPLQFFKFTFKGFVKRQPGFERKPGMPSNHSQPERQSAISPNIRQL